MPCNCSSTEDLDLHRYRCTDCGKVGYYSSSAKDHFEGGVRDSFIEDTNRDYMARRSGGDQFRNNPRREPQGHYTGRCGACGSNDLWDDNTAYGCNACGAFWC